MIFAYLKRQKHMQATGPFMLARLALEMNFVNHVLPSGGVSGISYMGWRLKHFGVSAARSTTAQLVRMVAAFGSFTVLLLIAIVLMIFDGDINRWVVGATIGLVAVMFGAFCVVIYLLDHERRLKVVSHNLVRLANKITRAIGIERHFTREPLDSFFSEIREDYRFIRANKRTLLIPFLWGLLYNVTEVAMFYVAFLALGYPINPAPLVIAYGLAGVAGFFMVTPGGAGAYEAIMVAFLAVAGLNPGIALLGILLARVLLMLGTIAAGYLFYQQAILKYGKRPNTSL